MAAADRGSLLERHAALASGVASVHALHKSEGGACLCTAACLLLCLCQGFLALRTATAKVELKNIAAHPLAIQWAPDRQEMVGCITHQHHQMSLPYP